METGTTASSAACRVAPAQPAAADRFELVSPAPESCYPVIWRLLQEFSHQTIDTFSPSSLEELIEKARRDLEAGGRSYAIFKEGIVVGAVWFDVAGDGICLGHLVFERKAISGTEKFKATRTAIKSIFADGFRKITWVFFVDNRAFRVFLKRLGDLTEILYQAH